MIRFKIDQAKTMFLDQPKIMAVMDARTRFVFNRWGAYCRSVARNSLKRRAGVSPPGKPPHAHGQGLLKQFLFYVYDKEARDMIVGPAKLEQRFSGEHRKPVDGTVPEVLEEGGKISLLEVRRFGEWRQAEFVKGAEGDRRFRQAVIAPRPYMIPAKKQADRKLDDWWRLAANKGEA